MSKEDQMSALWRLIFAKKRTLSFTVINKVLFHYAIRVTVSLQPLSLTNQSCWKILVLKYFQKKKKNSYVPCILLGCIEVLSLYE